MDKQVEDQNLMGAIAYFGFFVTGLFLLLTEKSNQFIRFHATQSVLFSLGLFLVLSGFAAMTTVPIVGGLINLFLIPVVLFGAFGIWAVLMWKAYNGEEYEAPIIGKIARRQLAKMG